MNAARAVGVILATVAAATPASAQQWRTLQSSRQIRSTDAATVRVEYAAGTIDLLPMSDVLLYRMTLTYDAERSQPIAAFDETAGTVTIGTRSASSHWDHGKSDGSTFRAELSRDVPLRLSMELGAARGTIQLGGLRLQDLSLKTGATKLTLDFAEPNPESLRNFDLDVGAAEVTVTRAGNARASRTSLNVGVGSLDYDLDGVWTGDTELSINLALGKFTLRVPPDAGVRVTGNRFLVDFDKAGLEKRGNTWYSPGYDAAKQRVTIQMSAAFGQFNLMRRKNTP